MLASEIMGFALTVIGAYAEEFEQPLLDELTTETISPLLRDDVEKVLIGEGAPWEIPFTKNSNNKTL